MKAYKKWTPAQRTAGLKIVNEAIKNGIIEKPSVCRHCLSTSGIHYHQENYDSPLDKETLIPVCFRCHIVIYHNYYNKPLTKQYLNDIASGKKFPPVYRRDVFFKQLSKGIYGE